MLDVVSAALDKKSEEGSPPKEPEKSTTSDSKVEADKTTPPKAEEELTKEELARLSVKAKSRYEAIIAQRKKAEALVSELEPKAAQFDLITRQIRETGLTQSDLNVGFDVMTLLKKGDYFGAREKLAPIWDQVSKATGGELPDDLVKEVAEGKLAEEHARELAVARAAMKVNADRQQMTQRETEERQQSELNTQVVNTVNAWEKSKAATDPDWKLKAPDIMKSIKLSLLEGKKPQSAQEAVNMAEAALEEVNAKFKALRPAPRAVRPVIAASGASKSNPAAPANMLDIVRAHAG
jgi:hypothetical protein